MLQAKTAKLDTKKECVIFLDADELQKKVTNSVVLGQPGWGYDIPLVAISSESPCA